MHRQNNALVAVTYANLQDVRQGERESQQFTRVQLYLIKIETPVVVVVVICVVMIIIYNIIIILLHHSLVKQLLTLTIKDTRKTLNRMNNNQLIEYYLIMQSLRVK